MYDITGMATMLCKWRAWDQPPPSSEIVLQRSLYSLIWLLTFSSWPAGPTCTPKYLPTRATMMPFHTLLREVARVATTARSAFRQSGIRMVFLAFSTKQVAAANVSNMEARKPRDSHSEAMAIAMSSAKA